jgi:integral membrane protein
MNLLKQLKFLAIGEGISYLVLFGNMLLVKPTNLVLYKKLLYPIGMAHGVLFMAYCVYVILVAINKKWNYKITLLGLIASLLPFGTFYFDKKYLN